MAEVTIPQKNRIEWRQMILGEIKHQFQNYVLQLQVHEAQKKIANNEISIEKAIDDLYDLCQKYALAVQRDFKQIFKTW